MTPKVFDDVYANQYDLLYSDKNYEVECNILEDVFRKYGTNKIQTILDLGCGTGNHALSLSSRGYEVTGVDLSAEMLTQARKKSANLFKGSNTISPIFLEDNLQKFEINKKFDVVLMMFAVLGYQIENEQISDALNTVRKHLRPGGLFIFDVWYGPAVLKIRPSDRVKVIQMEDGQLIRAASGSLDTYNHLAKIDYHLWRIQNKQIVNETIEQHIMRYFFPQELTYYLRQNQLILENLCAFPFIEQKASEETWNVLGISKLASNS